MKKQLPLTGIPLPERKPLMLDGEPGIDWQVDASPWPMPPARPWAPVPQTGLKAAWDRILDAVKL